MSKIQSNPFFLILFLFALCIYVLLGVNTQIKFIKANPFSESLLADFEYYEQALNRVFSNQDPYAVREIGPGYLYPLPALFIVEAFHYISDVQLKALVYSAFNVLLLLVLINGVAKYYTYSFKETWYWYVLCLGFAPFLETLQIGQINLITMFGVFLFFFWARSNPLISGFGLSLAILTKVSPILFFGYLIATKNYKSLLSTLGWVTLILILSAIRYGITPILSYPEVFTWISHQFIIDENSQALVSKIALIFDLKDNSVIQQGLQKILMIYISCLIGVSMLMTYLGKQFTEPLFLVTMLGMAISSNIVWYHHYVFLLLPMLIWMSWKKLDWQVIVWCLFGLSIIQIDRFYLTKGLLVHIFAHSLIIFILVSQVKSLSYRFMMK